jgi:hypothetical protein
MARPTDEQVRALAEFAAKVIRPVCEDFPFINPFELARIVQAEMGILGVERTMPDWLLEAARQHTLQSEDGSRE